MAGVSPARAGMVPPKMVPSGTQAGFPRASGDGPWHEYFKRMFIGFPPRERGWSHGICDARPHQCVSPARAGMVPLTAV